MEKKTRRRYNWAIAILISLVIYFGLMAKLQLGYTNEVHSQLEKEKAKTKELEIKLQKYQQLPL